MEREPAIFCFAPRTLAFFIADALLITPHRDEVASAESIVIIDAVSGLYHVIGASRRVERDGRDWLVKL